MPTTRKRNAHMSRGIPRQSKLVDFSSVAIFVWLPLRPLERNRMLWRRRPRDLFIQPMMSTPYTPTLSEMIGNERLCRAQATIAVCSDTRVWFVPKDDNQCANRQEETASKEPTNSDRDLAKARTDKVKSHGPRKVFAVKPETVLY